MIHLLHRGGEHRYNFIYCTNSTLLITAIPHPIHMFFDRATMGHWPVSSGSAHLTLCHLTFDNMIILPVVVSLLHWMSLTGAGYYFYCCPVVDPLLYHDLCWGQQLPGLFSHASGKAIAHQFLWILAVAAGLAAAVGAVAAVLAVAVMPAAVAGAVEL